MRKKLVAAAKDQQGEIMLEATMIFVPVLLLLFALLSLSFLFYQEAMMTSVANEVASDVARNYKFTDMEIGEDTITLDDVTKVAMFRTTFGKKEVEQKQAERAEAYAPWRVGLSSLGLNPGELKVDCNITGSGIGRTYVQVTVSQQSDFFLSGILDMLGITENGQMFSSTAYAECVDLMGYTSLVNFTAYGSKQLEAFQAIGNLYSSVKDFIQVLRK